MSLPLSREVGSVLQMAREIAGEAQEISTAHVLLALFQVPNQAAKLLADRHITEGRLKTAMAGLGAEPAHILLKVENRSERLATGSRAEAITTLHLLAALVRESSSHAYAALENCGVDIGAIRTAVMSYATSSRPVPRHYRTLEMPAVSGEDVHSEAMQKEKAPTAPTPIGFHPSLRVSGRTTQAEPAARSSRVVEPEMEEPPAETTARPRMAKKGRGTIESLRETGGGLALDNHPGINRGGKPRRQRPRSQEEIEAERHAEAMDDARRTTRDLAARLFAKKALAPSEPEEEPIEKRSFEDKPREKPEEWRVEARNSAPTDERVRKTEAPRQLRSRPAPAPAEPQVFPELAEQYELDAEDFPFLCQFGRNLSVEAALGQIDPVIGRDTEIAQLIDILGKRRSNNPLLVGEPGVGKTAIVEGLACRMVGMARRGSAFGERTIIELEMGRLLSGTHLRGAFSERLLGIKDEVAAAEGRVIVFLDEIHSWMGAGAGGDGGDAAGELKTALARGRFPCIGATTHDECRKFVESDPAFERRFQRVPVEEPDEETAIRIVDGIRTHYERHHGVAYAPEAIAAAVSMAVRYIHDRQLPDKAIGVLDLAGSRASRQGVAVVDREAVARVVADMAKIPAERLTGSDGARFMEMESFLSAGVVGHGEVVETIADLLRRNYAGFRSHRPIGSLLFLGPTGVGKTEMVKVLADFLFHDRDAIVRLDMSEFMEAHSVSRFIGAPPGYVGYDQGGQLTEAIRKRPYQVVLLDEIEKAHPDVLNLLLQLFDEGRLTDGRGRVIDFSNALVVMTSNLGASAFEEPGSSVAGRIGFSRWAVEEESGAGQRRLREKVLEAARGHFTPELWNRIDERLVFLPLSKEEVAQIACLQLADSQRRLREESAIEMEFSDAVVEHLIESGGYDPKLGARPMRQTIQRLVEGAVAREILSGRASEGGQILVDVEDGEIVVRV